MKMKTQKITILMMAGVLSLCMSMILATTAIAAEKYDLVILNGRVMDPETMFDAVRNVGVKDGKIVIITKDKIIGKETINAKGHVVAPGFIDTHDHSMDKFAAKMGVRDGLTSGMDLEIGALNIDKWYAEKKGNWPINYGVSVAQEFARDIVHDGLKIDGPVDATDMPKLRGEAAKDGVNGWADTPSNLEQMNQITAIIDENLRQGALGLGSTVGYMRKGVTTYEQFEAQRAAARYGRLTLVHTRFHGTTKAPTEAAMGFAEVFTNAVLLKAPLVIAHDNDYGWWEHQEKLQMARDMGLNMWAEYYPYAAGSTAIGSGFLQPDNWLDVLGYKYEETIYDPTQDKFLSKDEFVEIVKTDPGRVIIAHVPPRKEWEPYWYAMPHMTIAGDNTFGVGEDGKLLPWDAKYTEYAGHPRTAASRGKVLRRAREQDIPLMFTLHQLTYWSAKHLGDAGIEAMKVRGRMQVGMVADITIFDPDNVTDNATYKQHEQGTPTTGIPYVIVNGQIVVKDSKVQDVWAGQPIRYQVEEKGRFVPATKKQWLNTHSIDFSPIKPRD